MICAELYFKWNKLGGVGMRVEGAWSSRTLIFLNIVRTGKSETEKTFLDK